MVDPLRYNWLTGASSVAAFDQGDVADEFRKPVAQSATMAELCHGNIDLLLDQTRITAACNSFHGVEGRFCRWLRHTADRAESDQFMLKQELLSEMLGVRRTSVTDVAHALQQRSHRLFAWESAASGSQRPATIVLRVLRAAQAEYFLKLLWRLAQI